MDEVKEFIVIEEEEGDRLDVYLSEQLGDMSRSYIQKLIKDKKVKVNGKIEKANSYTNTSTEAFRGNTSRYTDKHSI